MTTTVLPFNASNLQNYNTWVSVRDLVTGGEVSSYGYQVLRPDNTGIKAKVNPADPDQILFSPYTDANRDTWWFVKTNGQYVPQKTVEASLYEERHKNATYPNLRQKYSFQARISSNSLTTRYGPNYKVRAFIKAFNKSWGDEGHIFSDFIAGGNTGVFNLALDITNAPTGDLEPVTLQWGFEMDGYPVYIKETDQQGFATLAAVPISCYLKGTKVLCLIDQTEEYIPIQHMKKGTLVKTYEEGYKAVELVGKSITMINDKEPTKSLYKLKGDNTTVVTGYHFMLEDEQPETQTDKHFYDRKLKFGDKWAVLACDSKQVEKVEYSGPETIYHLVLESEDETKGYGIYVEGALSESQSKKDFLKAGFELLV